MAKHVEKYFIPMRTPEKGSPWFAPNALRYRAKDSREAFVNMCGMADRPDAWKALKGEGWRIVRVTVAAVQ